MTGLVWAAAFVLLLLILLVACPLRQAHVQDRRTTERHR